MRPILMVSKANSSSMVLPAMLRLRRLSAVTPMINMTMPMMYQRTPVGELELAASVEARDGADAVVGFFKGFLGPVLRFAGPADYGYLIQESWIQVTGEAQGFLVTAQCPSSH
jgi:hypothetical protein